MREMRDWEFWGWVAYGLLATSVVGDAVEQLRKRWPEMSDKLPSFFNGAFWAFLPLVLLILGSIVFVCREFGWIGSNQAVTGVVSVPQTSGLNFVKTDLKLQFFGDHRIPTEASSTNVATWFAYYSPSIQMMLRDAEGKETQGQSVGPTWAIFVTLDTPSAMRQGIVSFSNPEKAPPMEVRFANSRSMVVTANGQIPAGVVEIHIEH